MAISKLHNSISEMEAHSETLGIVLGNLDQSRRRLSDQVIGAVRPRDRNVRHFGEAIVLVQGPPLQSARSTQPNITLPGHVDENARLAAKKEARRAQLRASQARFRQKQRKLQLEHQQHQRRLTQEIWTLRAKRQTLQHRGKSKSSPWGTVSEVLHLVETCFQSPRSIVSGDKAQANADMRRDLGVLRTMLTSDVAMGELHGPEALVEQLRRYALCFGDPQLRVDRIETVAQGVLRAVAALTITITETTIRSLFPRLHNVNNQDADTLRLRERILEQRLCCSCSVIFLFDEESGRVARLETAIDFVSSLKRVLGDLKDASRVLDCALVTPECLVGELSLGDRLL